ncbi:hypothetical protein [Sicyoidochytrium minutum DNA virus]|nr:hypothetical protein [Sicyoidochytrium minutum DNA virus]BDC17072.1 hypothetical protein [Sicyoidochytrium minutum DNA virus]
MIKESDDDYKSNEIEYGLVLYWIRRRFRIKEIKESYDLYHVFVKLEDRSTIRRKKPMTFRVRITDMESVMEINAIYCDQPYPKRF